MISASKAHDVKTKMTTLKNATGDKQIDLQNLIDKIAGCCLHSLYIKWLVPRPLQKRETEHETPRHFVVSYF